MGLVTHAAARTRDGRRTLEVMRESGIELAALEAGNTLILEKDSVISQASAWGIDLMGY